MGAASWFRYVYLAHFSQPKSARQLFRLVKHERVCRIVEIGVGELMRSISLIEVARRYAGDQKVCHTGLDWFDSRDPKLERLTLKDAYRSLRATGANVRLVPGSPAQSLVSAANSHQNTDLILISSAVSDDELRAAWFYVPRMLHASSVVLREHLSPEPSFERLTRSQVADWAVQAGARRAA